MVFCGTGKLDEVMRNRFRTVLNCVISSLTVESVTEHCAGNFRNRLNLRKENFKIVTGQSIRLSFHAANV
jgi:hypothetical protein